MTEGTEINISVKTSEGTIERILGLIGNKIPSPPLPTTHEIREENGEVIEVSPGVPTKELSSELTYKTSEEKIVHTFIVPPNVKIRLNPGDLGQDALFQPHDTDGNFMLGLIQIWVELALGGERQRVYAGSSEFHNADSPNVRRKWQVGYEMTPGDKLVTTFIPASEGTFDVKKSHLNHRVFSVKIKC